MYSSANFAVMTEIIARIIVSIVFFLRVRLPHSSDIIVWNNNRHKKWVLSDARNAGNSWTRRQDAQRRAETRNVAALLARKADRAGSLPFPPTTLTSHLQSAPATGRIGSRTSDVIIDKIGKWNSRVNHYI